MLLRFFIVLLAATLAVNGQTSSTPSSTSSGTSASTSTISAIGKNSSSTASGSITTGPGSSISTSTVTPSSTTTAAAGSSSSAAAAASTSSAPSDTSSSTTKPTVTISEKSENLTFALSASEIPGKDQLSQADAFVQVFVVDANKTEERIGTTEVVDNSDKPLWYNVFWFMWKRGTGQKLKFIVKDYDRLSSHDDIGEATVSADEYVDRSTVPGDPKAPALEISVPLDSGVGSLRIRRTYPKTFGLSASELPHLDTFDGHSDPFVEVYWRKGKEGENRLIGTTAVIDNEDNPNFPELFEFSNYIPGANQYLFFKVLDSDSITGNDDIGEFLLEADLYFKTFEKQSFLLQKSNSEATITIHPRQVPVGKLTLI